MTLLISELYDVHELIGTRTLINSLTRRTFCSGSCNRSKQHCNDNGLKNLKGRDKKKRNETANKTLPNCNLFSGSHSRFKTYCDKTQFEHKGCAGSGCFTIPRMGCTHTTARTSVWEQKDRRNSTAHRCGVDLGSSSNNASPIFPRCAKLTGMSVKN